VGGVTTADVFGECLHRYIITNAISDDNVLGFAVEYVGKYKQKSPDTLNADIFAETLVKGIDTREVLENNDRLSKITDYVLADWKRKTKNGKFNALFAVSNIDVLKRYYALFRERKPENFRIATIFTYQANEDESGDMLDVDVFAGEGTVGNQHSRTFSRAIGEYNKEY
jgi:type I restriction enzyme R subunit